MKKSFLSFGLAITTATIVRLLEAPYMLILTIGLIQYYGLLLMLDHRFAKTPPITDNEVYYRASILLMILTSVMLVVYFFKLDWTARWTSEELKYISGIITIVLIALYLVHMIGKTRNKELEKWHAENPESVK